MKKILPYLLPLVINPTLNFNGPININFGTQHIINGNRVLGNVVIKEQRVGEGYVQASFEE